MEWFPWVYLGVAILTLIVGIYVAGRVAANESDVFGFSLLALLCGIIWPVAFVIGGTWYFVYRIYQRN